VTWPSKCSATAKGMCWTSLPICRQPAHPLRDHRPRNLGKHPRQGHALCQRHGHHRHHYRRVAFLKEKNPAVRIIGAQPSEGSRIPGIRKWPQEYLPKIYDPSNVDELVYVSQADAEDMCRRLAREEGIFAGISAAGACWVAQEIASRERTPPSCLLCATVATATCLPACSPHDLTIHDRVHFAPVRHTAGNSSPRRKTAATKERLRCPACGFTHWNNPTPVLAAVIEYDGQVLLARNAAWPGKMYALITGFMEAGETPQEGIMREILRKPIWKPTRWT
jgi:hypothetical protein